MLEYLEYLAAIKKILLLLRNYVRPFSSPDTRHSVWIECGSSYIRTGLESDCYLLLRCPGVLCEDFDKYLETAKQKPVNQRVYMRNTARQLSVQSDSSEGEVEFRSK